MTKKARAYTPCLKTKASSNKKLTSLSLVKAGQALVQTKWFVVGNKTKGMAKLKIE